MGAMKTLALLPMAGLIVMACGRTTTSPSTAMNAQLRSDLERAASPTSDLALARFRATRTVSNVELGLGNGSQGNEAPRKSPSHRARHTLTPTVEAVSAITPQPAPMPTVVAASMDPGALAGPRPMPNPVGSIFRGGMIADDDHCQIHKGRGAMVGRVAPDRPVLGGMPGGMSGRPRGIW
jgi:hypothetical protein